MCNCVNNNGRLVSPCQSRLRANVFVGSIWAVAVLQVHEIWNWSHLFLFTALCFLFYFFPLSLLSVLVLEELRGAKHRKQLGRRRDTIPHSASHRRCDLNWCEIYAKAPNCSRKTDHGEGVRNEWPEWRWGRRTAETEGTWTCHRTEMDGEREREKQIERGRARTRTTDRHGKGAWMRWCERKEESENKKERKKKRRGESNEVMCERAESESQ